MCDMQKTMVITLTLLAMSALAASTFALQTTTKTIPSGGSIKGVGVGVYWNSMCTNATTSIPFGLLEPGASKSYTLYLKNEGNTAVTLSMLAQNWSPSAAGTYMTVFWNREGASIGAGQTISCILTLSVSPSIQGIDTFALDIVITGQG